MATSARIHVVPINAPASARRTKVAAQARRRPDRQQGIALETLGHAIEYLIDSDYYRHPAERSRDDSDAAQILMGLSRAVFAECMEVPAGVGFRLRLLRLLGGDPAQES